MHLFSRHTTPEIGIDELDELLASGSVHLLDVREDWEYRRGRVPGAVNVPMSRLTSQIATLPRDKPHAVICESGSRSMAATDFLLGQGFEGAVSVKGGTGAWVRSHRQVERD